MIEGLTLDFRRRCCQQDVAGRWLCSGCREPLADEDAVNCRACVAKAEDDRRQQEAAERRARWEADQRRRAAEVLERLPKWRHLQSAADTAACIDRRLLPVAERWTPSTGSLLLLGPSGVGKTSAAARALHRLGASRLDARLNDPRSLDAKRNLDEFLGCLWVTAFELSRAFDEHRLGNEGGPELIARAVAATALFVDECGPEPAHNSGRIFDIIDRRNNEGRPTIVTSGQTAEGLETKYGSGFVRRLKQRGLGAIVDCHRGEQRRGG